MRFKGTLIIVFLLLSLWRQSFATHMIGGEISYACLGANNDYRITLKLYRDGCPSCYIFDRVSYIGVYNKAGTLLKNLGISFKDSVLIPPDISNPCLQVPPDVIVWGTVLDTVVNLPPIAGGYVLTYQRCCRNNSILNIVSPGDVGSTYYIRIPDPAVVNCNVSPIYKKFPPVALCVNDPISFDHSAVDLEGDSLVYELCTPYDGADNVSPVPIPPLPPNPNYDTVVFVSPYSRTYPITSNPPLSIDPQTGLLTGTPTMVGQFVVGICVQEYRNGVLLSENKRDFQFNIIDCDPVVIASIPDYILECDGYTVNFTNNSFNGTFWEWDLGDGTTSVLEAPSHVYPDTGIYIATLIVNPGWPCADTATSTVGVYPGLNAGFSVQNQCVGDIFSFINSSTSANGAITGYTWVFGDGGTATNTNPSYIYNVDGTYNATLTTVNEKGCTDSYSAGVVAYPVPQPGFTFNTPCEKNPVSFVNTTIISSGSIATWSWSFNGEGVSNDENPAYIFDNPGSYNVTLTAISVNGCINNTQQNITIKPVPLSFAGNDTSICPVVPFSIGTASTQDYTYLWIPSNGLNDTLTSAPVITIDNPAFYDTTYKYTVTTLFDGCSSSDSVIIVIYPNINAEIPSQEGQCLEFNTFNFKATGVFGSDAGFSWNFGPNSNTTTSSSKTPSGISFLTTGEHIVTLSIDEKGCESTDRDTIRIYEVPVAGFTLPPGPGCDPYTVQFTDGSIGQGKFTYFWNFGDNNFSTDKNPVHTYSPSGNYTASLTITLEKCTGFPSMTNSANIAVNPAPVANFIVEPDEAIILSPFINFVDASSGGIACKIIPGDGDTVEMCNFRYMYSDTGTFTAMMVVENIYGCEDTITKQVRINPEFMFFAPNSFTPNGDGINDIFYPHLLGVDKYELFIFNRWGDDIFHTDNKANGWDGRANDGKNKAQQDVYVWIIKIKDVYQYPHRLIGRVALIR